MIGSTPAYGTPSARSSTFTQPCPSHADHGRPRPPRPDRGLPRHPLPRREASLHRTRAGDDRGLPTEEEQAEAFGELGEFAGKSVPSGHSEAGATAMRRRPSVDPFRVPCPPAQDGTECSRLHVLGCILHQNRSRRTGISVGRPADLGLGAFAPSAAWAYMQCRRCRACRSAWIRACLHDNPPESSSGVFVTGG